MNLSLERIRKNPVLPALKSALQYRLAARWTDLRCLAAEMAGMLRRNPVRVAFCCAVVLMIVVEVILPVEADWLRWIANYRKQPEASWLNRIAWALSEYGDFIGFNSLLIGGIYLIARARRSRFLRLIALASLLGTTFSGVTANILRASLGRARPNSREAPGFYGPSLAANRHSCPSGHTATAFGGSIPVLVAAPKLGAPFILAAAAVAWSRLHNRAHHPSDVLFSIALATIYGVPLGMAARRLAARVRSPSRNLPPDLDLHPTHAGGIEPLDAFAPQPVASSRHGIDETAAVA